MIDLLIRSATFEPSTYNAETHTVQAVISTCADVKRFDHLERLTRAASAWSTAATTIPVLKDHAKTVDSVVGRASNIRIENGQALAEIRLSDREDLAGFRRDVQNGIHPFLSIGFTVPKWREYSEGGMRVREAEQIVLHEVSFTPVPADRGARIRSNESMELTEQIRSMTTLMGLPAEFAERSFTTIEDARTAAVTELSRRAPAVDSRQPATVTRDAGDDLVTRMADGLLSRINPTHKPTVGREFAHSRFEDIARAILQRDGLSTLGSRADIITRALHTTSDFANVLQEAYAKELLTLRVSQQSPIAQIFRRTTMPDFRTRHYMEMADGPALEKVNEAGEIRYGTVTDKALANFALKSYGRIFAISFQALVNDDLSVFGDLTGMMSRGARTWFATFLVDTLLANPKLADNVVLFHASHGNLAAAGAVPSETTITAGKTALRMQTDLSGNPINAEPKYIVIPAALEGQLDRLMAELYPAAPADANVAARSLTPIVDPRLDAKGQTTAWYLFADPAVAPVLEYTELEGYAGPQIETRSGWNVLGVEVRVVWHLGAGAIDSRGAYKNPGA